MNTPVKQETNLLNAFGKDYKVRVEQAISALQQGKGILLVDDENRENEGDLIFPAETMTAPDMALMIRECSGIVCLCITEEKAASLDLPFMVAANTSRFQTAFTVSIEAKEGVTTGVSAKDRITTIQTASKNDVLPGHLARPGHVFPLVAKKNGVLERPGHTEGSIDLVKLAGFKPMAVLCELTNADGTMAKLPEISAFATVHSLTVLSVEDLINYRKFVTHHN
jgi:3,4-dihydroxy 2-butanone 4-phosphate synthase